MNKPIPSTHIHIIDDDDAVRQALSLLIRSQGGHACAYGSAEDFLAATASIQKPAKANCLVLDLQLRGQNGAELLEHLQREERMLPVILITGHSGAALVQRAVQAGALAVVRKPFRNGELLSVLSEILADDSTRV